MHGTARRHARARASAAAARPPSLSLWGLQRGGVGRSRVPGLAAGAVGRFLRRSGLRPVGASDRAPVLTNVQPGSIVLFHANGRGWHTEGALPGIIATLKARGYEFATVSELLAAGEPVVSATCYDSRPGDTDRPRHPLPVATGPFG